MSELHDPYEDQLSAARYKAERDQARQEAERLRERLEDAEGCKLTDKERRVLELWPRWEDTGEPVMLRECTSILFGQEALSIENRGCFKTYGYGERVKRPEPEVLAGDGKPLHKGERVWHEDGTEMEVTGFGDIEDGERLVVVKCIDGPTDWSMCRCLSLTHEPPDTWEKWLKDAMLSAHDYWCGAGTEQSNGDLRNEAKARGLMHRAKALCERGAE